MSPSTFEGGRAGNSLLLIFWRTARHVVGDSLNVENKVALKLVLFARSCCGAVDEGDGGTVEGGIAKETDGTSDGAGGAG